MAQTTGGAVMEKRKHKRIQYGRTVNVITDAGDRMKLEVLDYSMGGMGLVSDVEFTPGHVLEFESILTRDGEMRPLELKGEVIHIHAQSPQYTIGVSFL